MCGRISLSAADHRAAAELLAAAVPGFEAEGLASWLDAAGYEARTNIGPGQRHWVVRARAGRPILDSAQWGFAATSNKLIINARAETMAERPMFRASFTHHRALIPADGFFEWAREGKGKQPHWFHRPERSAIMLAALLAPAQRQQPARFCVVTQPASEALGWIHHRMPLIIEPEAVHEWLLAPGPRAASLVGHAPVLDSFPVDPAFNAARHQAPLLEYTPDPSPVTPPLFPS